MKKLLNFDYIFYGMGCLASKKKTFSFDAGQDHYRDTGILKGFFYR